MGIRFNISERLWAYLFFSVCLALFWTGVIMSDRFVQNEPFLGYYHINQIGMYMMTIGLVPAINELLMYIRENVL